LLSVIGDQLARVALTVLVYQRTGSAVLAAVTCKAHEYRNLSRCSQEFIKQRSKHFH
jgi:hypothetical protein